MILATCRKFSPAFAPKRWSPHRGRFLGRVTFLCGLLALAACADRPSNADRIKLAVAVQDAIARRDYDLAYGHLVKWKGEAAVSAAEQLRQDLAGGLEYFAWRVTPSPDDAEVTDRKDFSDGSDWYRRDLMMQVSFEERWWVACMMKKHRGELRSFKVLSDFADQYRATGQPFPNASTKQIECRPPKYDSAEEEAFFRGNYADLYRLALPRAEQGNGEAEFKVATVLLYAPKPSFDLMPEAERRRTGMMWLRKAADADDYDALGELSSSYRWGLNGLPQDAELAQCFKEARHHWADIATCRAMEKARGYVEER